MEIETFKESDIREAAQLAYPIWGVGHAASGQGKEFGLLMCEYIVRYGWYGPLTPSRLQIAARWSDVSSQE